MIHQDGPAIPPISDESAKRFEAVTSGEFNNFLLVSTLFMGKPVNVIAAYKTDESGETHVQPLYLEITDEIFEMLTDPATTV